MKLKMKDILIFFKIQENNFPYKVLSKIIGPWRHSGSALVGVQLQFIKKLTKIGKFRENWFPKSFDYFFSNLDFSFSLATVY